MPKTITRTAAQAEAFFKRLESDLAEVAIQDLLDLESLTPRARLEAAAIMIEVALEIEEERRAEARKQRKAPAPPVVGGVE